jgi:hypothetical protein
VLIITNRIGGLNFTSGQIHRHTDKWPTYIYDRLGRDRVGVLAIGKDKKHYKEFLNSYVLSDIMVVIQLIIFSLATAKFTTFW